MSNSDRSSIDKIVTEIRTKLESRKCKGVIIVSLESSAKGGDSYMLDIQALAPTTSTDEEKEEIKVLSSMFSHTHKLYESMQIEIQNLLHGLVRNDEVYH